jgi:heme/copper-type cytochrome/quinol oxidase subunit 2
MEQKEQYVNEIKAIRQMMEQSSRFLSLSGLSGILIGVYTLVGAYFAHVLIHGTATEFIITSNKGELVSQLFILAIIILAVSIVTVIVLTYRKTKRDGHKIWNKSTRLLILNLAVPLVSGGILTAIFVVQGFYETVAPSLLVFYGLALVNAAKFTRQEIYYLGICQIVIGIIAALMPEYALFLWAFGFGAVHIFYGSVMHFKYDYYSKTKKS